MKTALVYAQVIDLPAQLDAVFDWLRGLLDKGTLPTTIAGIAAAIAIWSAAITRRGAKASERNAGAAELQAQNAIRQAEIAEQQATAAFDQARSASMDASASHQANELMALESARARTDALMPRVMVQIFEKADLAGLEVSPNLANAPISPSGNKCVKLSHWATDGSTDKSPQWAWDAYFVSYGLIQNFSQEPVRVVTTDVQFYAGKHPITQDDIPKLAPMQDGVRLLYPGDHALFQVVARKQVDDWVQILKDKPGARGSCKHYIWFYPADRNDSELGVKITTRGMPLRFVVPKEVYAIFDPKSWFEVTLEFIRIYPDSVEEVIARLKNDKEGLWQVQLSKMRREQIRNKGLWGEDSAS